MMVFPAMYPRPVPTKKLYPVARLGMGAKVTALGFAVGVTPFPYVEVLNLSPAAPAAPVAPVTPVPCAPVAPV